MTLRVLSGLALVLPLSFLLAGGSSAADKIFELAIVGRKVAQSPNVVRVHQGDAVELRWSSDELAELHLHGYDIEARVKPGAPSTMRFTARATGRFPITAHRFGEPKKSTAQSGHGHDHAEVTLLYLEVLPR